VLVTAVDVVACLTCTTAPPAGAAHDGTPAATVKTSPAVPIPKRVTAADPVA
jgi:hypothetical protein